MNAYRAGSLVHLARNGKRIDVREGVRQPTKPVAAPPFLHPDTQPLCARDELAPIFEKAGDRGLARDIAAAQQVCGSCPLRVECLDYATSSHQSWGVWGGLAMGPYARPQRISA